MDITGNGGVLAAGFSQGTALGPSALARAAATLEQWRRASVARRELAELDDEQLADIGLSRAQLKWVVPIRSIGPSQRPRIVEHLFALDTFDRYLRFAYAATDEHIRRYVNGIDFERDQVFGIFSRKLELLAMAHLAPAGTDECDSCVEIGVSVAKRARRRGWGTRLLERASIHARNEGVRLLLLRALAENAPMLKIARRAGATVHTRGAEAEARLPLPAPTMDSRIREMACQGYGETDYRIKEKALGLTNLVLAVRDARSGEPAA